MSINISNSIAKHLTDITGTLSFESMPVKTRKMIETYTYNGVSATAGLAARVAKYLRVGGGLQYVMYGGYSSVSAWNIHEQAVYDAFIAACTAAKLDTNISRYGDDGPSFYFSTDGGPAYRYPIKEFIKHKPRRFQVYYHGVHENLHLKKLCDPMKIDTTQPIKINLREI